MDRQIFAPAALLVGTLLVAPAAAQNQRSRSDSGGQNQQRQSQAQQSSGVSVQGEVIRSREIGVRRTGTNHLVVLLRTDRDRLAMVDLGPADSLRQSTQIAKGDRLSASGKLAAIGDRHVLMANSIRQDGKRIEIQRRREQSTARPRLDRTARGEGRRGDQQQARSNARRQTGGVERGNITGTVQQMKTVDLRGTADKHVVVLLQTRRGLRVPVDLGPKQGLRNVRVSRGDEITVDGALVKLGDRQVVIGEAVRIDGRRVSIRQRPTQRLTGEITDLKTVRLPGADRSTLLARFQTNQGRTLIASLGSTDRIRRGELQTGDRVEITGRVVPVHGRSFLFAQKVTADGRTIRPAHQGQPDKQQARTRR